MKDQPVCQSEYDRDAAMIEGIVEQLAFATPESRFESYYWFGIVVLARLNDEFPRLHLTWLIKLLAGRRYEVLQESEWLGGDFVVQRRGSQG